MNLIYQINQILPILQSNFINENQQENDQKIEFLKQITPNMTDSYKKVYKSLPSSSKSYLPEEFNEIADDFFESPPNSYVYLTNLSLFLSNVFDIEGSLKD